MRMCQRRLYKYPGLAKLDVFVPKVGAEAELVKYLDTYAQYPKVDAWV